MLHVTVLSLVLSAPVFQDDAASQPAVASKSDAVKIAVPFGKAPIVDGVVTGSEWQDAHRVEISKTESIYVKHDGTDVYFAILAGRPGFGSFHVCRGDELLVMHASAALATARYQKADEDWTLDAKFTFTQSDGYYEKERWTASTTQRTAEGMEFRIARNLLEPAATAKPAEAAESSKPSDAAKPEPERAAARVQFGYGIPGGALTHWPVPLADERRGTQLIVGHAPKRVAFEPKLWATLELKAEEPEQKKSR